MAPQFDSQVDAESRWALERALSTKPWLRGVAQALLAAFQARHVFKSSKL